MRRTCSTTRAMVARKARQDRRGRSAGLRRVVEVKPDDAQALNALGYTLVDRTPRTSEGFALIEKAYKLSPEDPFILDSMGWAFYRLGNLDDAEVVPSPRDDAAPGRRNRRAPGRGAVEEGRSRCARSEVWQSQLKTTPANEVLLETVRRYSK